jgi:hypothetical protein
LKSLNLRPVVRQRDRICRVSAQSSAHTRRQLILATSAGSTAFSYLLPPQADAAEDEAFSDKVFSAHKYFKTTPYQSPLSKHYLVSVGTYSFSSKERNRLWIGTC